MNTYFVSDFLLSEIVGGSEYVDNTVAKQLGLKITKCSDFNPKKNDKIVLSNISTMNQEKVDFIRDNCDYIILEHDYKIHWTRHPWRFKDNIIPPNQRINYGLYRNAKAVFTQTDDHTEIFKLNEVEANFISLKCSIWSEEELDLLDELRKDKVSSRYAVIDSDNWIKNTAYALDLCRSNKWDYNLIPKTDYREFLEALSKCSTLVFFPVARESCCRLLIEARALGLNTITSDNSGAFRSEWYSLSGIKLTNYLRQQSKENFKMIRKYLETCKILIQN